MAQTDDYDSHDDSSWFRDQLRQRDHLIAELTSELDKSASHFEPPVASVGGANKVTLGPNSISS